MISRETPAFFPDVEIIFEVNKTDERYHVPQLVKLAESHGKRVSTHLWPEISAQLMCVTPNAHWLEYAEWWNPILNTPLLIKEGMTVIDDALGTGISWNEKAVERYSA